MRQDDDFDAELKELVDAELKRLVEEARPVCVLKVPSEAELRGDAS